MIMSRYDQARRDFKNSQSVDTHIEERLRMYCAVRIKELRLKLLKVPQGHISSPALEAKVIGESNGYKNIVKFLNYYGSA